MKKVFSTWLTWEATEKLSNLPGQVAPKWLGWEGTRVSFSTSSCFSLPLHQAKGGHVPRDCSSARHTVPAPLSSFACLLLTQPNLWKSPVTLSGFFLGDSERCACRCETTAIICLVSGSQTLLGPFLWRGLSLYLTYQWGASSIHKPSDCTWVRAVPDLSA